MSHWPVVLYTIAVLLASLTGGIMPIIVKLTHKTMQFAVSFVAGVMLGVGFLHMLPHAVNVLHDARYAMLWVTGGFLLTFFVQRFFLIHHHAVSHEHESKDQHTGAHSHAHQHPDETGALECANRDLVAERFTWTGAAVGLAIHSLTSGVALAAAYEAERETSLWAGGATFLAIFIHKPFDSLTIVTLMTAGKWPAKTCHLVNALFSLAIPAGVILFYLGLQNLTGLQTQILGCTLAISAGTFICIAASDLLPEMQLHSHDRGELSFWLLAGLALAFLVGHYSP